MTTAPKKRRATYQDLLDAPETAIAEMLALHFAAEAVRERELPLLSPR